MANHPSYSEFPFTFEDVKVPTLVQVGTEDPVGPLVITQFETEMLMLPFQMFPGEQVQEVKDKIFPHKKGCEVVVRQCFLVVVLLELVLIGSRYRSECCSWVWYSR